MNKSIIQLHFWVTDMQAINHGVRQGHHIVDVDADELGELRQKFKTNYDWHDDDKQYHHYITNDELIPIIKTENPTKLAKEILIKSIEK
jgi:hypothetical protein